MGVPAKVVHISCFFWLCCHTL